MDNQLLHTPEGVRDIYRDECLKKIAVQDGIKKVFHLFGYEDIETPSFEYFEVFSKEVGTIPSKDLYKFFDREGNTLVLRPDITPSIARAVTKYFSDEDIKRFSGIFSLLLREGKRLRVSCILTTTRLEDELIYHMNKDAFSDFVVGVTSPEVAKELLGDDISDWLANGHDYNKFIFKNRNMRVQMRSYHSVLGIGLL